MERSWVHLVVGAAALFVVVAGIKHFSGSDSPSDFEEASASRPQVASLPERVSSDKGGWIARPGDAEPGNAMGTRGPGLQGSRATGAPGARSDSGSGGTSSDQRGGSVVVDRGRTAAGSGSGGTGFRASAGGIAGPGGGDALEVGSSVPVVDAPFDGARPITGPIGGAGGGRTASHDAVQQVTDKPADGSKPVPDDGGPVLSLPFDKSTEPDRGDGAVFSQGITFDSGQGAVFQTDSQFVVPNGGNLKGDGGAISMWVQPSWAGGDESNASLAQLRNQNQWDDRLQIFKNGVYLRFLMASSGTAEGQGQESNIGLNISDWAPGDWHNVVASWGQNDSGQLVQQFYVDGKLVGQEPVKGGFNVRPGTPLYIGSDLPQGISGLGGAISQFKAFGGAVTPDQVSSLASDRPQ